MIRTATGALSEALSDAGHDGPIKLRLPRSAFEALMQELCPMLRVEIPEELARGARRTVRLGSVEVVE